MPGPHEFSRWSPLLRGTSHEPAVWSRIATLRAALLVPDHDRPFPWEAALFFGHLSAVTGDAQDRDECERLLQVTRQSLPTSGHLYGGLAGVGWTISHLRSLGLASSHERLLGAIDRALLKDLREEPESYELLYGVAGTALYAVERGNLELLRQAIGWLDRLAWELPDGIAWPVPAPLLPGGKAVGSTWDLGVAHGVPGVLPALNAAISRGVDGALRLRDGAVRWLQAQRSTTEGGFPNFCGLDASTGLARQGWCYGDVGAACALAYTDSIQAREMARELALTSARRPAHLSRVQDEWLCHGSSGLAHLYTRLACRLGAPLEEAALRWYDLLLAGEPAPSGLEQAACLLEGAAGEGLALLASVSALDPGWDRLLGCSLLDSSPDTNGATR